MKYKHSIVLINVYFGKYPWYFSYFLHSCKFNRDIDFILLTDCKENIIEVPSHIHLMLYSIDDFRRDASIALGFDIAIDNGYKLCDFKPAFGCIFREYTEKFDYWGYCDIDLIFGNIREYMSDDLLSVYDVISSRHDYLTGSFALYRNTPFVNRLFENSRDYKRVFTSSQHLCFDETNFEFPQFINKVNYIDIISEIESMTQVVMKLDAEGRIKAYFELQILEGLPGNMVWDNGDLVYKQSYSVLYYHLIYFKDFYNIALAPNEAIPDRFEINQTDIRFMDRKIQ